MLCMNFINYYTSVGYKFGENGYFGSRNFKNYGCFWVFNWTYFNNSVTNCSKILEQIIITITKQNYKKKSDL